MRDDFIVRFLNRSTRIMGWLCFPMAVACVVTAIISPDWLSYSVTAFALAGLGTAFLRATPVTLEQLNRFRSG